MASTRKIDNIESAIYPIRGQRVMLDSDVAEIYGVTTIRLNEQLRRNLKRFPEDFAFQLTREEFVRLRSQFAISKRGRSGRRYLPWVFTEHGALILGRGRSQRAETDGPAVRPYPQARDRISRSGAIVPL